MRLLLTSALLATALTTAPALTQTADDRAFLAKDVQGARYELALGKLAEVKASRAPVRSYARMIVHDHEIANAALVRLAQIEGVQAPSGMTPQDTQTLAKLNGLDGDAFDKAYLYEVTRINAEDASDSERETSSTHDERIRFHVKRFSSMDDKHKKMGEELKAKFG